MPTSADALTNLTAAILAGGLGTRLRQVVSDRPKVLASVGGRPLLARLLDQLAAAGIREAVLCTGYLGEQLEATFGKQYHGLPLAYSREPSPLGTGGALRAALPLLASDPVLVMNGDSYCHADFTALRTLHESRGAEATLSLVPMADTGRYGRVRIGADGELLALEEKAQASGPGWINAGIYLMGRRIIESIPPDVAVSLEREVFPAWVGRGLYGCPGDWPFLDIGTPESYAAAEAFFAQF